MRMELVFSIHHWRWLILIRDLCVGTTTRHVRRHQIRTAKSLLHLLVEPQWGSSGRGIREYMSQGRLCVTHLLTHQGRREG